MSIFDLFRKKAEEEPVCASADTETTTVTDSDTTGPEVKAEVNVQTEKEANKEVEKQDQKEAGKEEKAFGDVAPQNIGKLDMVIAFDTTGSMAQYIGAVRQEVTDLIPQLFKENEDLRLGIVAFGDYCDMKNPQEFGDAYQVIYPTDNVNELIGFVVTSKNTFGGDGPEFYELVIKKIVEETPWREGSTRSILLIADAQPHELGYSCEEFVKNNKIDWREEARKASEKRIKIDTVTITDEPWFKELSAMTNGISVPFRTGSKTADLVRASAMARGSMEARICFDKLMDDYEKSSDEEMKQVFRSYKTERDRFPDF